MQEFPYEFNKLIALTDEQYFAAPGLSSHGVMDMMQSPKHYYARNVEGKRKPSTAAQEFGRLVHMAILQTELFESRMVIQPKFDLRTTVGKEQKKAFDASLQPGALPIDRESFDELQKIIESWKAHPFSEKFKESCLAEHALFWKDKETGIICKMKPDLVTIKPITHKDITIPAGLCIDLKTTVDARSSEFIRSIFNYNYDIQAAWYLEGLKESNIGDGESYLWLALEKEPPFEIDSHTMESHYFSEANEINKLMRKRFKECKEKNFWPGYTKSVKSLHFASYMVEQRERLIEEIKFEMRAL